MRARRPCNAEHRGYWTSPHTSKETAARDMPRSVDLPLFVHSLLGDDVDTGKQLRSCLGGLEIREVAAEETWMKTYGVVNGGLELMHEALSSLTCSWTVRLYPDVAPAGGPPAPVFGAVDATLLESHPVDLLVWEGGRAKPMAWTALHGSVQEAQRRARPSVILESWQEGSSVWSQGPVSSSADAAWKRLGYITRNKLISSLRVGGAIRQRRLLVVRYHQSSPLTWTWAPEEPPAEPRPMSNLLDPPGLVNRTAYLGRLYQKAPDCRTQPMPPKIGRLIRTEKGIRRLQAHELSRGLGAANLTPGTPTEQIEASTSLFLWSYLLEGTWYKKPFPSPILRQGPEDVMPGPPGNRVKTGHFSWKPPDLVADSTWRRARVQRLENAAREYPNPSELISDGLRRLEIHRKNYDHDGPRPTTLQVLWWEFPREHWDLLRNGSPMNFLIPPGPAIHPNSPMDPPQLDAACEFVDELVDLGVLIPPPQGMEVLTTTPLFCVDKPHQPGQLRVIADMLRGGQNQVVGADPVFLPKVTHILDSLYAEGFSAVVDASKFFYQFPTDPSDYPYLGVVHPRTLEKLVWAGLPMGSGNSPALASRFGIGFLRLLQQGFDHYQGTGRANCYWTGFQDSGSYDPTLGYGMVYTHKGQGAVLIWVYVDDFLIHAPTEDLCQKGLTQFMDTALNCGLLCHPDKLVPPSQEVKYCGLLLNTQSTPTLKMPQSKKERALSMCQHVIGSPKRNWSRLALSVVSGVLESLAECTPRRLGHTHLRALHDLIHSDREGTGLGPYLTCACLNQDSLDGLIWWEEHLRLGPGRMVRAIHASILVPTFGDGSGTGTGGTFHLPFATLRMWKATWGIQVYHFTSNHKELSTLRLTLEHIKSTSPTSVRHTTLFYFTDNSCTYWVCMKGSSRQPHLHSELVAIRDLELELGCHLAVVHVPGKVIIREGTDGLSRGVWVSPLHAQLPRDVLLPNIFAPLHPDATLVRYYIIHHVMDYHRGNGSSLPLNLHKWRLMDWSSPWHEQNIMGSFTVWFPPPELARQSISYLLYRYVEDPLHTSGLFFVPRVLPAFWQNLSKYVIELPTLYPHRSDLAFSLSRPPLLPIPVLVLYLPPHVRRVPPRDRLDQASPPHRARWHQKQAEEMRRLPPTPVDP